MGWILTVIMLGASIRFRIVSIIRRRAFIWVVERVDMVTGVARGLDPEAGRFTRNDAEVTPMNVTSFVYGKILFLLFTQETAGLLFQRTGRRSKNKLKLKQKRILLLLQSTWTLQINHYKNFKLKGLNTFFIDCIYKIILFYFLFYQKS